MASSTSPAEGRPHAAPPTTHTLDQRQVAEINERLGDGAVVTAGAVGLTEAGSPEARLTHVVLEGSPEFPYVYGVLGEGTRVPLHTDALRAISHALHLQGHHWGL